MYNPETDQYDEDQATGSEDPDETAKNQQTPKSRDELVAQAITSAALVCTPAGLLMFSVLTKTPQYLYEDGFMTLPLKIIAYGFTLAALLTVTSLISIIFTQTGPQKDPSTQRQPDGTFITPKLDVENPVWHPTEKPRF